ncbi:MAG: hypothetical protein DI570_08715 [Phenylobacterium zucineum]|nr:MAG: hypothetical protein DI570_08715 [Phenylobacterium zucineum]
MTLTLDDAFAAIARDGYVVLPGAVAPDAVTALLNRMQAVQAARAGAEEVDQPFLNRGHDVLYSLQREDVAFARAFTDDPLLMGLLRRLLNDTWYRQIPADQANFIMRSLIGRSSGPAVLPLHIDSFIPSSGSLSFSCQVSIVLEPQTPERGCTVVIPGSHLFDRYADQESMAQAIPILAEAGDMVVWDSRLWHGALGNTTGLSRWALIATFTRWWIKQNFDMTGTLPQPIYEALTDDEKAIFGFCSRPPRDEFERTDIKSGHDQLKARVEDYRS